MKLSTHFTLAELVASDAAERHPALLALQQHPPEPVVERLRYLCEQCLEPLRLLIGWPISVTSGYRCRALNALVGGSPHSQHVLGEAADIRVTPDWLASPHGRALQRELAAVVGEQAETWSALGVLWGAIALRLADLDVDQVIHEYGPSIGAPAWVHVAASARQDRRRVTLVGRYTAWRYVDRGLQSLRGR